MSRVEVITKKWLCIQYDMSPRLLGEYFNTQYFEELAAVGYKKNMKRIPPVVYRKFLELHGHPVTKEETTHGKD